jgi:hypothetical protein
MSDTLPPLRFRWATYCDRGLVNTGCASTAGAPTASRPETSPHRRPRTCSSSRENTMRTRSPWPPTRPGYSPTSSAPPDR